MMPRILRTPSLISVGAHRLLAIAVRASPVAIAGERRMGCWCNPRRGCIIGAFPRNGEPTTRGNCRCIMLGRRCNRLCKCRVFRGCFNTPDQESLERLNEDRNRVIERNRVVALVPQQDVVVVPQLDDVTVVQDDDEDERLERRGERRAVVAVVEQEDVAVVEQEAVVVVAPHPQVSVAVERGEQRNERSCK
ncbi:hypothetical protein ACFE04_026376 [Oxalis oulophora]